MAFGILSHLTRSHKIAIAITSMVAIGVSVYIVLCNLVEFDGAFNTQAAINLYRHGSLTLNYRPNITLQTLLPFQVVNGFFFTIFGNTFLATNLANVLFYVLLYGLFVFLSYAYKSLLPLLAFTIMSLNHAFHVFGFGGYGEMPALTFGLLGVTFFVFRKESLTAHIFAGILIAFAITTKWVLFLIMPSVLLTILMVKPDRKNLMCFLGAILFTSVLAISFEFSHIETDEIRVFLRSLVYQNTPHYGGPYLPQEANSLTTYGSRLKEVWDAYSNVSFGVFTQVKIGLSLIIVLTAIHMLFRRGGRLERKDIFFIFLASFLFVYLAWAFALNSRWHMRRIFNADILLYLSVGLLPYVAGLNRAGKFAVFGVLATFCFFYTLLFVADAKNWRSYSLITYEHQMRKGLKLLPDNYNAYGNGFLEAPHWSFLAGKDFKDLFLDSVFYDCIEGNCHNYLFLDSEIGGHKEQLDLILETFELKEVFEFSEPQVSRVDGYVAFSDFKILRIEGFRNNGKAYVEVIDFPEEKAAQSITRIHTRTRNKMYRPPQFEYNEMAAFLDNKRGLPLLEVEVFADECHDGKNLRVALLNSRGKLIQNVTVNQGENSFKIALPEEFRGSKIDVYLLLEKELRNTAHHCKGQNANRIPLVYKMIRLVAEAGELK